jgi:hypothetical protein
VNVSNNCVTSIQWNVIQWLKWDKTQWKKMKGP